MFSIHSLWSFFAAHSSGALRIEIMSDMAKVKMPLKLI